MARRAISDATPAQKETTAGYGQAEGKLSYKIILPTFEPLAPGSGPSEVPQFLQAPSYPEP